MKCDLTSDKLKELLHYCPETGVFTHIPRARELFGNEGAYLTWVKKFSGREAGAVTMAGYRIIRVDGGRYFAHRLAWLYAYGKWPESIMDHINHNRLDNRIENLREVSYLDNCKNKALSQKNKSGCAGVIWHRSNNYWQASIKHNGRNVFLGAFKKKTEAIERRIAANAEYGYHANHGLPKALVSG